jgi:hypothetical protein
MSHSKCVSDCSQWSSKPSSHGLNKQRIKYFVTQKWYYGILSSDASERATTLANFVAKYKLAFRCQFIFFEIPNERSSNGLEQCVLFFCTKSCFLYSFTHACANTQLHTGHFETVYCRNKRRSFKTYRAVLTYVNSLHTIHTVSCSHTNAGTIMSYCSASPKYRSCWQNACCNNLRAPTTNVWSLKRLCSFRIRSLFANNGDAIAFLNDKSQLPNNLGGEVIKFCALTLEL